MSNECVNIFIIQIEYTAQRNTTLKQLKDKQKKKIFTMIILFKIGKTVDNTQK